MLRFSTRRTIPFLFFCLVCAEIDKTTSSNPVLRKRNNDPTPTTPRIPTKANASKMTPTSAVRSPQADDMNQCALVAEMRS